MSFCTQCGQALSEGEMHSCQQVAAGSAEFEGNLIMSMQNQAKRVDFNIIFSLLKNPVRAKNLQPGNDFIYGILGVVSSLFGLLIMAWLLNKKLVSMINDIFGGFGGYGSLLDLSNSSDQISSKIIGKIFLIGIVSIVALMASLWLTGNWKGNRKLSAKEIITYIGGMQYTFAAGFVIAGLCSLINLRLLFLMLAINLLSALTTIIINSTDISNVSRERLFSFTTLSISIYLVLFMLITAIVI